MSWQFRALSDIGARQEQQDRVEVLSPGGRQAHMVVLADGMGGHRDGAMAAQAVLDTARDLFREPVEDPPVLLRRVCARAHRTIGRMGSGGRSPGSTCVLLYLDGSQASWAHVGDSRLYHFRRGELVDRTFDHSVLRLMLEQGRLERTDPAAEQLQGQLYMRLGGEEPPEPELGQGPVRPGDHFLLCSDGLWAWVEPEEAGSVLRGAPLEEGADRLLALARERGGAQGDNVSLAVAAWPVRSGRLFARLLGRGRSAP